MKPYVTLGEQLQRNLVALISVFIAVSSLSYNTWRNEKTEYNRNLRQASFQVLLELGELRELVYHLRYDSETVEEDAVRSGWVIVLTIIDLAHVLEPPLPDAAESLRGTWQAHWKSVDSEASKDAVESEINAMRDITLSMLQALD